MPTTVLRAPRIFRPCDDPVILSFKSYFRSSYGLRREPEGIEHESTPKSSRPSSALQGGLYDHSQEYDHKKSQEYDPYQSAARQMQDLLFGTSSGKKKTHFGNRIYLDQFKTVLVL